MKVLLVTFSDNADHQDTLFGMYEQLQQDKEMEATLLAIQTPKVPLQKSERTWLVDCPERPGLCKKTLNLPLLNSIIKKIKKEKFDAIYFESLHVWNLPIMLALRNKAKIYHVIHEVIPHEGDRQVALVDLMNKAIVKYAHTVVLRNQTYIEQMTQRYPIGLERIQFLELWRRYPEFTEPVSSGRALFFGRINPYKGIENLLQIVRLCPEIQFDVVGRVDPQMEELAKILADEKNVHLNAEYVSDDEMRQVFVDADWVVAPYSSASQSGVIIDAYKYARPVIAYDVGAIPEQMADGKSGYLIPAGDNETFARTLRKAMAMERNAYTAMCKQAYEFGKMKYAASGAVQRFKEIFEAKQ